MSDQTRLGLAILGAAAVLGVLGDALLRETPWGINWTLWTLAVVAGVLVLARVLRLTPSPRWRWLLPVVVFFAAALAWRDSLTLGMLNVSMALAALALAMRGPAGATFREGTSSYAAAGGRFVGEAVAGALIAPLDDVKWSEVPRGRGSAHIAPALRGVAIAVPLLLVFGGLLVAADAVFESLVRDVFDVGDPLRHLFVFLLWAWLGAGFVRHVLHEKEPQQAASQPWIGPIEASIVLGTLVVLFLAFVAVQFGYFFGGKERVLEETGLTYAEYARSGFFELVTVSALALALLLLGDAVLRRDNPRGVRIFRWLAGALVVLLAVIMVSALQRMRLYTDEYGLTELRVYTTAFMVWVGVVLGWFVATVLRGLRDLFAVGGLVAAFAIAALLNAINPDALIARTNIGHERDLDTLYITELSEDATPTILDRIDDVHGKDREFLLDILRRRNDGDDDWRTWNWSRTRARDRLAQFDRFSDSATNR